MIIPSKKSDSKNNGSDQVIEKTIEANSDTVKKRDKEIRFNKRQKQERCQQEGN